MKNSCQKEDKHWAQSASLQLFKGTIISYISTKTGWNSLFIYDSVEGILPLKLNVKLDWIY
jgi:hypothetical protein